MAERLRIGVDLGGTKIEVIALDQWGNVSGCERVATPQGDYAATVDAIRSVVMGMEQRIGARGTIGVGIPGAISPATGWVKNANSVCLIGRSLENDLVRALGREVRIANDADCFAISEATDGAAADARVVFGVIVGTGTGGGIVVDGRLLAGPNAIAGEWGHNPLPWPTLEELPGPLCYCGRCGCIETWLSGPGLARASGLGIDAKTLVLRAEAGDKVAEAAFSLYEGRMARALASVINLLDPDVIVLGGGVSNIARLYHNVPRLWGEYVFSDRVDTRLLPPHHGDSSGVRGAARLWPL